AFLLARSARLPWGLRGALAGGAVLLAEVALLGQSRGALYATPVVIVLVLALVGGRARTFAMLAPVAAGIGATAPAVLRVANRLTSGLGSNRYDFYRVALDEFVAHPLVGIGADNFQQQYLRHGRSSETPRYPHSVELRTLSETGIVGSALGLAGLAAALAAGWRAVRAAPGRELLAGEVAIAALGGFAYWLVHGSVAWF